MSINDVAYQLISWAKNKGLMLNAPSNPQFDVTALQEFVPQDDAAVNLEKSELGLTSSKMNGVLIDEENAIVYILAKNALGERKVKPFPKAIGDVEIRYVGHTQIEPNPPVPSHIPYAGSLPHTPCYIHANRISCGSSVTAAPAPGAGTMGCLVRAKDGSLCGLTNNHVTGTCNHTEQGMHILMPAPQDALPGEPAPFGIGKHRNFAPLQSGNPQQVQLQKLDAALFTICDDDKVSSMQGAGVYDTPSISTQPTGQLRVKKVGRTTGLTTGTILGQYATPFPIPYQSANFNAMVYFEEVWLIQGDNGEPFSQPGDSGSLVVSEDGRHAIGLIFAGVNGLSAMLPIEAVLNEFGVSLVNNHGI